MRRWWCAGVVPAAALGALAPLGLVLWRGFSARPEPPAFEASLARRLRGLAMPDAVRDAPNPLQATPRVLAAGLAHFADHCASCHANDGSGATPLGRQLYPRAPDLRGPATQGLSDGALYAIIEDGIRYSGMPGWGGAGKPEESWKLVSFIRHLPALSAEEEGQMRRLNPRGPEAWQELQEEEEFLRGGPAAPAAKPDVHH